MKKLNLKLNLVLLLLLQNSFVSFTLDEPGAIWMPNPNFFFGRYGEIPRWIIIQGSVGGISAEGVANWFQDPRAKVSSHFIVGKDGLIVQCVDELNAAYSNGRIQKGADPWWYKYANPNYVTISINLVKESLNNSDVLAEAQQTATFNLIRNIIHRHWAILPSRANETGGITGHFSIAPTSHKRSPGPFPWEKLFEFLKENKTESVPKGSKVIYDQNGKFFMYGIVTAKSGLRVRSRPAPESNVTRELDYGETQRVLELVQGSNVSGNNLWYRIPNGFVSAYYFQVSTEVENYFKQKLQKLNTGAGAGGNDNLDSEIFGGIGAGVLLIMGLAIFVWWYQNRFKQQSLNYIGTFKNLKKTTNSSNKDVKKTNNNYSLPYDMKYEIARENLIFDGWKLVGVGGSGVVLRGFVLKDGKKQIVAIKTTQTNDDVKIFNAFLNEIKILGQVQNHPNIVSLIATCTDSLKQYKAFAALEFCANGNLIRFLKQQRRKQAQGSIPTEASEIKSDLPSTTDIDKETEEMETEGEGSELASLQNQLLKISWEVANGMKYLGDCGIIHRDLAARNILLTSDLEVKISDFGLSVQVKEAISTYKELGEEDKRFPFRWMPIEALRDKQFSLKSDVWSYGILLWEIFSLGENPYGEFHHLNWFQLCNKLNQGYRMKCPLYANQRMYRIMKECWDKETWKRPHFNLIYRQILQRKSSLDGNNDYVVVLDPNQT